MAVNMTNKKLNFVSRFTAAVNANTDHANDLAALCNECKAMGYVPGLGTANAAAAITDADLNTPGPGGAQAPFPHLTAADLAAAVNSLATVREFRESGGHTANSLKMRA